ncbi:hypothetical protein FACS189430_10570 [Bacteroidia bacterium]|nr:hypothetical protein FACS189430_10570 [Bacteroidia bacterium]
MGKSTNFIGQPILNQLLFYTKDVKISKIAKKHNAEHYVKQFDTRQHLIVMLFGVIEGYHSIRELVIGMLSNAHKLAHLGMNYMVRRSTLSEVHLEAGSFITFDKGYVDYAEYERFTKEDVFYVTRLKDNAKYDAGEEYDIPDEADSGVLKDEEIVLYYGKDGKKKHRSRRIAYWDAENQRLFEFITNNFEITAEKVAMIYKKRWQIELLFKQLKQNFPLKYFLGDNQNAIEIQIWVSMLANLLLTLVKSKVKRNWAFSNMASVIRQQLMNYINIYRFLEDPEGSWRQVIYEEKMAFQNSLFPK